MLLALVIGGFCIAFLLSWGLNWLALISWRRSAGKHWTERARLLYPAQKSARLNNWLIPANLAVLTWYLLPEMNVLDAFVSGIFGSVLAGYFSSREVNADLTFKSWLHLVIAITCLIFVRWAMLIFAIVEMPDNFGALTWLMAGGVLLLLLGFQFGLGIYLMRWLRILKPASEHLRRLVTEVSSKMTVQVRATWILFAPISNAAAFPETRQLVFTEKLLSTLTDDEVKAICAHELGHLNEPRRVKFSRVLVGLMLFPIIFAKPMSSLGEIGTNAFWLLLIVVLVLWLLGIRLARNMEKRADKIGAETMENALFYVRALERIYEINQVPAVMSRRATKIHPDLYDRMLSAGVTPGFPKPVPAKGQGWTSIVTFVSLFAMPIVFFPFRFLLAILDAVTFHVK